MMPCSGPPGAPRASTHFSSRVIEKRRGVMPLDSCVDDQGAGHPQCLHEIGTDPVDIAGRVGAGEGRPEEVVQGAGRKVAVIDDHHHGESVDGGIGGERTTKGLDDLVLTSPGSGAGGALNDQHPGEGHMRLGKPRGRFRSPGISVGSSRRLRPAAAITTFDPSLSPLPE